MVGRIEHCYDVCVWLYTICTDDENDFFLYPQKQTGRKHSERCQCPPASPPPPAPSSLLFTHCISPCRTDVVTSHSIANPDWMFFHAGVDGLVCI